MRVTPRLHLVPLTSALVEAFEHSRAALGQQLAVTVPDTFPVFPESFTFWRVPGNPTPEAMAPWGQYLFVDRARALLLGDGGYRGAPDALGRVELGYAIVPAERGKGFATEATGELVRRAFDDRSTLCVIAHTRADGAASIGVLQKLGFVRETELHDPEEGPLLRWALLRTELQSPS